LEKELSKADNQEQRIATVLEILMSSSKQMVNKSEVRDAITEFLLKYNICQSYIPREKLSMDINIIEKSTKLLANDVIVVKELYGK
ncbi:fatty acid synthase, partial [Nephila pilipes]